MGSGGQFHPGGCSSVWIHWDTWSGIPRSAQAGEGSSWQEWGPQTPSKVTQTPRASPSLAVPPVICQWGWAAHARFKLSSGLSRTQAGLSCPVLVQGGAVNPGMEPPPKPGIFYRHFSHSWQCLHIKWGSCWTRLCALLVPIPRFSLL